MPGGKNGYSPWVASNPYIVGSFACIGGGLFGLDISSMSGVLNNPSYLNTFGHPHGTIQGAITASMPGGSLVGALAVGKLADILGRKWTIALSGWIWVLGAILQSAAQNRAMLVVGRVIGGISIGIASSTVPLYQAEITKPSIRGRMVSLQQWAITWGILIQYFIQFGSSYIKDGNSTTSFRLPWGLQAIPGVVLAIGMMWFPESPRWLMDHDRNDEALQILADVHGKGDIHHDLVQLEYNEIHQAVTFERSEGARSYFDLLKPGILRRVSLGMSLQAWSQLTGMNVMMYYIIYVFEGAGLVGRRANLIASSVQYVLNVAFTIPAIIYIDRWGRRPMMIGGFIMMAFFLFLVGGLQGSFGHLATAADGTTSWIVENHKSITYGIIISSYLFVSSFAITLGPTSWTYPSEIFPLRVRSKAISLSTASNWIFNFALAFAVPPGLENIHYNTYFLFATFNVLGAIHVFFMFPETKQLTLEEVEDIFAQGHVFSAWKIKSDHSKRTLADVVGKEKNLQSPTTPDDDKVNYAHQEHV